MAKLSCYLIFPLGLTWLIILLVTTPSSSAESDDSNGFTIDLIHCDSHKSPSYDPSATLLDRHLRALSRSISCTDSIARRRRNLRNQRLSVEDVKSELYPAGGEYYMEIAIGTPPVQTLVIADTGSDLTWTQCKPCNPCYPQHPPIFDPDNSSSYHLISCPSDTCEMLGAAGSCSQLGKCQYNYFYGDGSATGGDVATESITLGLNSGSPVTVPRISVGCGHSNIGTYDAKGSGIVGLGGGRLSLISQMEHLIRGRFSYCLAPFSKPNATSKISFGSHSVVSGRDVVSTPLVPRAPDTFYYVNLESISLGSKNLPYKTGHGTENMVIDSGTTYNTITAEMYRPFESALLEVVRARRVQIPNMGLCFETRTDPDIPQVTFHFKGGDLLMKPANIFARVSDDMVCLTILPATDIAILGSYGQADFNVGFDLKERMVSFKPTDCTACTN